MKISYRWMLGYDESGNRFHIRQKTRWDYVHGYDWIQGWETEFHTKRYV